MQPRLSLFIPAVLALAACAPEPAASARLLVRGAIHYTDDVGGFAYTVVGVECGTGVRLADATPLQATVRADGFYLPSGASGAGAAEGPIYGDHTFVIAPGCYDIESQPLRGASDEPSEYCLPAHARAVQVSDGLTTEVTLISQCPGGPARALQDVSATSNAPPSIITTVAEPSATVAACEAVEICVNAGDPDGDPIEFEWEVVAGSPAIPPSALDTIRGGDGSLTQCAVVRGGALGELDLRVVAYDLARDDARRPVRIDDALREQGVPAGSSASASIGVSANEECVVAGRTVALLFALHGPAGRTLAPADARRLAGNAARWAGRSEAPRVLVVRDQNHRGEDLADVDALVEDLRAELGAAAVDRIDEEDLPVPGSLRVDDLAGYDAVWLANPGAPIDGLATVAALIDFRGGGGGVILGGDDIAQFQYPPSLVDTLTFARFDNGGASACGVTIDDWGEDAYRVEFAADAHPVLAGLGGAFAYANDLDHVSLIGGGAASLATATFAVDGCEVTTPAILAMDPADAEGP